MADPTIPPLIPGNRVLIGKSGIPFEVLGGVASALVREDDSIRYCDGLEPEPAPTVANNDEIPPGDHVAAMPARAAE